MPYSPWADDFLDMLAETVTLAPFAGITGNGQKSYGTARTYHARISADAKAIYGPTGQTVFSTGKVILHPKAVDGTVLTTITPDAQLTMSDGVTRPRIVDVGPVYDEVGIVYFEVRT